MANQVYEKIRGELEIKRRAAQRDAQERKISIYKQIPFLSELDRQISLTASEYSVRIIGGENVEAEMERELNLLYDKRRECLKANGLTEDIFQPRYSCSKCCDTGIDGADYCCCFKKRVIEENFATSNIGTSLSHQSFERFDLSYYPDEKFKNFPQTSRANMEKNLLVCRTFANNFDNVKKSLLMAGGTGLGKTFLSTCIAKQVLESGKSVIYISAVDFFKTIEKTRFDQSDTDVLLFETCDLLIIDDLGTEPPSAYTVAVFSDIFDKRIRNERKMIFSSNLNFSDFEKVYGNRVFSRLVGSFEYLPFYGNDIRVQKYMKRDDS